MTLILGIAYEFGIRWNGTSSMPLGLWRVTTSPLRLERGMTVTLCLPASAITLMALTRGYIAPGKCSSGTEQLLKRIGAVSGDVVSVTATGLLVNGVLVPNSSQKSADPAGRPLPVQPLGDYRVADGEFWAIAQEQWSFDSRYFGKLPLSALVSAATPVLVW